MSYIYLDAEYHNANDPVSEVVSFSYQIDDQEPVGVWLYKDPKAKADFVSFLNSNTDIIVAWQLLAEVGAMLSIGYDPKDRECIDLAMEWRQLKNKDNSFRYGRVFVDKARTKTGFSKLGGKETGDSLVDVLYHQFNLNLDADHKTGMRDLILSRGTGAEFDGVPFTDEDKANILKYNISDIVHLPRMRKAFDAEFTYRRNGLKIADLREWQYTRSEYIKSLAHCERLGCPLDLDALSNLSENHEKITHEAIEAVNKDFNVFLFNEKTGKYQFKTRMFTDELARLGLLATWAKTDKGNYKKDEDTLADNKHIPEIAALMRANKITQQLKWFRPDAIGEFMQKVGSDGHLRSYLGPFGTQTGRNAARAKSYIFAMSSWLRCLIRPPKGYSITGIDYSSQEFAVAAALSEDRAMIEAYKSGDPYLYFAKAAGAVPPEGTKETHKAERDLFKATTLGLQYGMGVVKLAKKLSYDCGRLVTEMEAKKLVDLHKRIFPRYWEYLREIQHTYFDLKRPLTLKDGWTLWLDNESALSVRNFPVQGTGACIMRRAVNLAREAGLQVITPLHDAMYILHKDVDTLKCTETLKLCMQGAALEYIDMEIRLDAKTVTHDEPWVEPKGEEDFKQFKKYLYKEGA